MKKWVKRTLILGICCLLAAAFIWNAVDFTAYDYSPLIPRAVKVAATDFKPEGTDPKAGNMRVAAHNGSLELCVDPKTAEIAVVDKRTGSVWYSNPPDRGQTKANDAIVNSLSSQISVSFFDSKRNTVNYTSFGDSVSKKQFKVQSIQNGVKVSYTLGTLTTKTDSIPKKITKQRLDEILGKVKTEEDKDAISDGYIDDPDQEGRMIFLDATANSDIAMNRILEGFKEAGYTSKDLALDNSKAGVQAGSEASYFVIPIEYRLEDDKLAVTIPTDQIIEKGANKIISIDPLEFFAAGSKKDSGYLFVPSGCGGLINFNNGKGNSDSFMQTVYGEDSASVRGIRTEETEPVRMPVFGVKKGKDAVFAYIDKGAGDAAVVAGVSGEACPYNYVYPRFTLRTTDQVEIAQTSGTNGKMNIIENRLSSDDPTVKYCFLRREDSDYSGMARYYRELLTQEGVLKPLKGKEPVPFYLDILGAVEKEKYFVGVPYRGIVPMTTYGQAEEILSALQKKNVRNVKMRYLGWFNNGVSNDVPRTVKMVGSLGGKNDLLFLNRSLSESGGTLYPDAAFQQVSADSHHYKAAKDSARQLDQWSAKTAKADRATLAMTGSYYGSVFHVVSPNILPGIVDSFLPKYKSIGVKSLSLRDLGSILTSDKRNTYPIGREASQAIVVDQLKKMHLENRLMISGGNLYSLPYADDLVDVPSAGNSYYLLDETIPFYEMVVHGSVDYAGEAVNLEEKQDLNTQLLRMMEYGLAPHYIFSYRNGSELKDTAYEDYYSTDYRNWLVEAAENYQKVDSVYRKLRTARIDRFVVCQKGVYETDYDNGTAVYVNETSEPVRVGSVTVDAGGYILGGKQN